MKYIRPVVVDDEFRGQRMADPSTGLDTCICSLHRMQPGHVSNIGLHVHTVDQFDYVIKGEMTIQVGRQVLKVTAGQVVYVPAGMPHNIWNESGAEELHFELIVPPPPDGEPLATKVDDSYPVPDIGDLQLVRSFEESQFKPERFSSVTLADRASGVDSVSMALFRVPPGGNGPALHVHRFDQIYFVITGTITVQIGFEMYEAGPNSLIILPAGMPHTNWNYGNELEYHLNLRVPQPADRLRLWDIPVTFGEEKLREPEAAAAATT